MAEEENLLIASDVYLKSGIHIGTKFKTKYMENFIYKTRSDGLSVLNLKRIDERIATAAKLLAQYSPDEIVVAARRENAWKPAKLMGKYTGIKIFAGRYPPGIMTNPQLENFIEPKIILVADPWPDKNVVEDAKNVGVPVIAMCDTNNQSNDLDLVVPCNNKGKKSLGLLFWVLTREFMKAKGMIKSDEEFTHTPEDFTEE